MAMQARAGVTRRAAAARGTILVVDRDPLVARVLSEMLSALGYVGLPCANAQDAVDICATGAVGGVLAEGELRLADGGHLITRLHERFPALPLGLLDVPRGYGEAAGFPEARVELAKPARLEDLERAAHVLLNKRHLVAV